MTVGSDRPSAMPRVSPLVEAFGWMGTVAIIAAYALTSFSVLPSAHLAVLLLNALGALGIAVVSYLKRAYQPAVLNVVWLAIAAIALCRLAFF